jgi:hypothetical protein
MQNPAGPPSGRLWAGRLARHSEGEDALATAGRMPALHYQINLMANWICRDGVCVDVIKPAVGIGCGSNRILLSSGGAKLLWLKTLKNSARN